MPRAAELLRIGGGLSGDGWAKLYEDTNIYKDWDFGGAYINLSSSGDIGLGACGRNADYGAIPPYPLPDPAALILALSNALILSKRLKDAA